MWLLAMLLYVVGAVGVTVVFGFIANLVLGLFFTAGAETAAAVERKSERLANGILAFTGITGFGVLGVIFNFIDLGIILTYTLCAFLVAPQYQVTFAILGGIWAWNRHGWLSGAFLFLAIYGIKLITA